MKHILLLVTLIFVQFTLYIDVMAQTVVRHTIQPGETLGFLSQRFHVERSEIIKSNPNFTEAEYFVGMTINIPVPEHTESSLLSAGGPENSFIRDANNYYDSSEFKKATKLYTKAIENNPYPDYYYLRGKSLYQRGKYQEAIADFESAFNAENLSPAYRKHCGQLLTFAKEYVESHNARGERIGGIILASLATAGAAVAQYFTMSMDSYNSTSTYPNVGDSYSQWKEASATGFNPNLPTELINLRYQTLQEVQQQSYLEYEQFASLCKKSDGSRYTYEEWCALKGQAIMEMKANEISTITTGNQVIPNGNNSDMITPAPPVVHPCPYCKNGRKTISQSVSMLGTTDYKVHCNECGGDFYRSTGHSHIDCGHCGGSGKMK